MSVEVSVQSTSNPVIDHLGLWSSVYVKKAMTGRGSNGKINPYGIQKLRELILELAVRGKLVPQDLNDEPASVLLEKLDEEKARLIKEGRLKKQRALPTVTDEEQAFVLPLNWEWSRLQNCYDVRDGTHDSPKPQMAGFPLVTSKNLYTGKLDLTDVKYISEEDHRKIVERSGVDKGDVLFAMIGSIGNPVIVDIDEEFSIKNVALFKYYLLSLSSPRYLQIFLENAAIEMKEKAAGGVQSFVSLGKLRKHVIALPPLAEQHRIVAKVDELMALCDQLEQQLTDSLQAHQTLVETLLAALVRPTAMDGGSEENAGAIFFEHFDTLFTTEESIDQLKQTLLQLAVMGKLVTQDPDDEPASELLDKIAKEKEKLIKEKKIKIIKQLNMSDEDKIIFEIPPSWEWVRFADIAFQITDGAHHTPTYVGEGVPFLSVKDMSNGVLSFADTRYISEEQHQELIKRCFPERGDLLLTKVGTTGIPVLIDTDNEFSIFVSVALIKFPKDKILGQYLSLLVKSPLVKNQSDEGTEGIGNKNLVLRKIAAFKLVIPPLNEQQRIVNKVDELMVLCETLKSRIADAQTTQIHLADAVVEQAVA